MVVRYIDGAAYYTVSEIADAAGVSPQTIRSWESAGRLHGRRSSGGHRLFDTEAKQAATQHAATQRRSTIVERTLPISTNPEITSQEWAATGARIRAAREQAGLTQAAAAAEADISRSLLSAVERGESGISVQAFSRIAKALNIPMSDLAPAPTNDNRIMRRADRPRTVLAEGVTWEELAGPGHSIAPAILLVPKGSSSGGTLTLPHENFVMVIEGILEFQVARHPDPLRLTSGETLVILAGEAHSWHNPGDSTATAFWVEQLTG